MNRPPHDYAVDRPLTALDVPFAQPRSVRERHAATGQRVFERLGEGRYYLALCDVGIRFDADGVHQERYGLVGMLRVQCELPGAKTYHGNLPAATLNFSNLRDRNERAKLLAERSHAPEIDWFGLLDEFSTEIHARELAGDPALVLRDVPSLGPDQELTIDGLVLPKYHPSILFGPAGTAKSWMALHLGGELERRGVRVGYFDWELDEFTHRERLEAEHGADHMPRLLYVRCARPLVHEVDRLKRIVTDEKIQYAIFDSVAYATEGAPESAESANAYFRAVRQLGVGSLHIAHVTKNGEENDKQPFGSIFWFNSARSVWYTKIATATDDVSRLTVGLYHRKRNLGRILPAVGVQIDFTPTGTTFRRVDITDVQDLAAGLPLWQRLKAVLKDGAKSIPALADELDAKPETIKRTVNRLSRLFVKLPSADGKALIGLVDRRSVA